MDDYTDWPSPTAAQRPKSKFSYKDLLQMAKYNVNSPLRVIAHIDLDAFYAQCEMIRLGVPEDQPLAVQQWDALIAVNYPARSFGITRMRNVADAKRKCPTLMAVHVATWRVQNDTAVMGYHDMTNASISTDKVSLDHYRRESKKILAIFREGCPKVEKASVDESFLDLSGLVFGKLLERFEEELGVVDGEIVPPYGDTTERLRMPEVAGVEWGRSHLVDLDDGEEGEEEPIDWDDIIMGIAAEIIADIRGEVRRRLGYTCSAGISRNKMLAKLGSGYKKPNQQTIVRNRAITHFLSSMKFTSIRNLGGKLGSEVATAFGTENVSEVLSVPLETFKAKLGDDTGTWLYKTIRGIDTTEVLTRTDIKSMLSAKSFSPAITRYQQGENWLKVFCADIVSRVNEEADEPVEYSPSHDDNAALGSQPVSLRRPRTMTLHHRSGKITKSRQAGIPVGKVFDEELLLPIARNLLKQIEQEGRCWPCGNLSLSVGGFDDIGRGSNRGIGGWLVKGEEAKALKEESLKRRSLAIEEGRVETTKKRKVGIDTFFSRGRAGEEVYDRDIGFDDKEDIEVDDGFFHSDENEKEEMGFDLEVEDDLYGGPSKDSPLENHHSSDPTTTNYKNLDRNAPPPSTIRTSSSVRTRFFSKENTPTTPITTDPTKPTKSQYMEEETAFPCSRCNNKLIPLDKLDEHSDWHFAKDLLQEDRIVRPASSNNASSSSSTTTASTSNTSKNGKKDEKQETSSQTVVPVKRGRGRPPKHAIVHVQGDNGPVLEKGQKKLAFGRG
ncbi:DNA-directed DNA polymerase eta rad30 [Orbilia oligospora]|nr:DNA-directed DNA polymerase eta rad30 [Orbilia oligospora]KAF3241558.1 DNA-directed DNA polymerase eta rad30 [Orbilia oligospora]KAF3243299.1 DNA-directed DNA polymerase eta rad30 [Orbilia oligospora]KAF3243300.1 DNA-directed DNA polymerase eta rad30, variant 2 [Orbilia oligospora]